MKARYIRFKTFLVFLVWGIFISTIRAGYYKSDFFPIGITGINDTGNGVNPPYANVYPNPWTWDQGSERREDSLIFSLGVNCIGGQDANVRYIGSLDTTQCRNQNNYLYQICTPSFMDDGDSANPEHIYIIEFIDITELIDSLLIDSLPDSLNIED